MAHRHRLRHQCPRSHRLEQWPPQRQPRPSPVALPKHRPGRTPGGGQRPATSAARPEASGSVARLHGVP
eukprot:8643210-Alexandrium_andersonii.AAC.1